MAVMIAVILTIAVIGILYIRVSHPEVDVKSGSEFVGNVVTTIVGALVGFMGGRAQGRIEGANGHT